MAEPPNKRPVNFKGMEVFDVRPVVLGGSAKDPTNKVILTRKQHIEAVRYWNRVIAQMDKR